MQDAACSQLALLPDSGHARLRARAREPALFTGTIRENIAGWRDVSDEEVAAAAAAANAAGFISRAPDGYATKVSA